MHLYPKIPVITDSDYKVTLEPHAGVLWVHCDVSGLSLSSFKRMKEDWKAFTQEQGSDLYVLYDTRVNIPSKHYIKAFGFEYFKDLPHKEHYQIWKRGK